MVDAAAAEQWRQQRAEKRERELIAPQPQDAPCAAVGACADNPAMPVAAIEIMIVAPAAKAAKQKTEHASQTWNETDSTAQTDATNSPSSAYACDSQGNHGDGGGRADDGAPRTRRTDAVLTLRTAARARLTAHLSGRLAHARRARGDG